MNQIIYISTSEQSGINLTKCQKTCLLKSDISVCYQTFRVNPIKGFISSMDYGSSEKLSKEKKKLFHGLQGYLNQAQFHLESLYTVERPIQFLIV